MNTNERPTPETDAEELHDPYLVRELPFCVVRIDFARRLERQRDEAREENARLREAVSKVLNFIPAPTCDQMHHTKKDRHEYGKTCPPVERVKAIIDNARKILTP